ncbi:hypothetical protein Y032_0003g1378 [Ancylostoma ceylanicum]|uniref:Uncharacterized protein n=1 Tax=Ancylostoma ceylanicum TaxID=53326 RepID=A0A016VXP6_9BILA|nr:hypothetical protein Y032_0003g1378 [Ancylostoma ceylanicum]
MTTPGAESQISAVGIQNGWTSSAIEHCVMHRSERRMNPSFFSAKNGGYREVKNGLSALTASVWMHAGEGHPDANAVQILHCSS